MGFSVGIGLTNECNLRCPHCYRPDMMIDRLTLQDVRRVCDSIPVRSMNLGVGENGLHPQYHAILEYLWGRGITTTVTSNGLSIEALTDEGVKRVNIYQPAKTDRFTLTYDQFGEGFKGLLGAARLVTTTEPVLAAVLGLEGFAGPGCGRSTVRVVPDGRILLCTYWPTSRLTLADLA